VTDTLEPRRRRTDGGACGHMPVPWQYRAAVQGPGGKTVGAIFRTGHLGILHPVAVKPELQSNGDWEASASFIVTATAAYAPLCVENGLLREALAPFASFAHEGIEVADHTGYALVPEDFEKARTVISRLGTALDDLAPVSAEHAARVDTLERERDAAVRSRDFTHQWYATRWEAIKDVAKRVGVWNEVAGIMANGGSMRHLPDGTYETNTAPSYELLLNAALHKAKAAVEEQERLRARIADLEAGRVAAMDTVS
jgi:hypothetical protein